MTKQILAMTLLLLPAISAAESYRIKFHLPGDLSGKQLKPGEYTLTIKDGDAVLSSGANKIHTPVRVEQSEAKNKRTTVTYTNENGNLSISEIRVKNSNLRILFPKGSQAGF